MRSDRAQSIHLLADVPQLLHAGLDCLDSLLDVRDPILFHQGGLAIRTVQFFQIASDVVLSALPACVR